MTVEALKSTQITNLDATPVVASTAGEGAVGTQMVVYGYVSPTQLAAGDYYRLCRLPTQAKIRTVFIATNKALDSNSSNTLALDVNIAHSDSTVDGTPGNLTGLIPTNAGTGATTPVGTYTNPNILFGTVTAATMGHTAALAPTEITNLGGTSHYDMVVKGNTSLWSLMGYSQDPGGFFDILVYASTGAATAVTTGSLSIRVEYNV